MAIKKIDADDGKLLFYGRIEDAEMVAASITAYGVASIYDELVKAREDAYSNANITMLLTNLANNLYKAAQR